MFRKFEKREVHSTFIDNNLGANLVDTRLIIKSNKGFWVTANELSGCGFESSCSHLSFRFHACFEQGAPWHSSNSRVWIHSEMRTWHDKNIQSKYFDFYFVLSTFIVNTRGLFFWMIKSITAIKVFQRILDGSNQTSNKVWLDKGSKFYNRSVGSWLEDNDTEMYSTHNKGKSFVAERLIKTLKKKIYKYMTSTWKKCACW